MFTYRGQVVSEEDIEFINQLIASNPGMSRWALSRELCRQKETEKNHGRKPAADYTGAEKFKVDHVL